MEVASGEYEVDLVKAASVMRRFKPKPSPGTEEWETRSNTTSFPTLKSQGELQIKKRFLLHDPKMNMFLLALSYLT